MKFDFTDQVAVITGAAGNLGVAVARAFHQSGAKLALVDRAPDRLPKLYENLTDPPDLFFTPPTDVTNPDSVAATIEEIIRRFGRIDSLVNTAGGYRAGTPLHETPISEWDFMLNLNARSVFVTCRAVIPQMARQNYGRIINIASRAATGADAGNAAYSASKTAVVRITESIDADLKEFEINANSIMPGIIDTPQNRAAMPKADFSKWVPPEAIADVILFLASEASRGIRGAAIPVYGRS